MKFEIEVISNGYLLIVDNEKYAYEDFHDILAFIQDQFEVGSRHSESRIYIIKAPGDKHPNFTEEHNKVIYGDG